MRFLIKQLISLFKCYEECPHYLIEESYHGTCKRWALIAPNWHGGGKHVCERGHTW